VRVSPESFDAILTTTGSRAVESHGQRVELESDPSIRGAGALLDAGSASVDARLETRLERVRDALQAARRSGAIGEAA
jgi:flagellar biosynthesis/type III secretory pathway protein FliH